MGVDNKFSFVLQGSVIQWYSEKTNLSDLKQVKRNIRGYISLQLNMRLNALPALPETSNQFVHGFVLAGSREKKKAKVCFVVAHKKEIKVRERALRFWPHRKESEVNGSKKLKRRCNGSAIRARKCSQESNLK